MICLNLSWNNIQTKGGVKIWESLIENKVLQILDLSFNPLGTYGKQEIKVMKKRMKNQAPSQKISQILSKMFLKNHSLIHWDFSNWKFSYKEWLEMSEGLNKNHTILGLHMIGNEMNTNALGFLYKSKGDTAASHILPSLSKILNNEEQTHSKFDFDVTSNWWIWERWTQLRINIDVKNLIPPLSEELNENTKIYINFSLDNYEPDILNFDENNGKYYSIRMVRNKFSWYEDELF